MHDSCRSRSSRSPEAWKPSATSLALSARKQAATLTLSRAACLVCSNLSAQVSRVQRSLRAVWQRRFLQNERILDARLLLIVLLATPGPRGYVTYICSRCDPTDRLHVDPAMLARREELNRPCTLHMSIGYVTVEVLTTVPTVGSCSRRQQWQSAAVACGSSSRSGGRRQW